MKKLFIVTVLGLTSSYALAAQGITTLEQANRNQVASAVKKDLGIQRMDDAMKTILNSILPRERQQLEAATRDQTKESDFKTIGAAVFNRFGNQIDDRKYELDTKAVRPNSSAQFVRKNKEGTITEYVIFRSPLISMVRVYSDPKTLDDQDGEDSRYKDFEEITVARAFNIHSGKEMESVHIKTKNGTSDRLSLSEFIDFFAAQAARETSSNTGSSGESEPASSASSAR